MTQVPRGRAVQLWSHRTGNTWALASQAVVQTKQTQASSEGECGLPSLLGTPATEPGDIPSQHFSWRQGDPEPGQGRGESREPSRSGVSKCPQGQIRASLGTLGASSHLPPTGSIWSGGCPGSLPIHDTQAGAWREIEETKPHFPSTAARGHFIWETWF